MKKKILLTVVAIICIVMSLSLVACQKLAKLGGMSDLVTELKAGTIDIGIIDQVMAKYLLGMEGADSLQLIDDLVFEEEEYGIGFRKGDIALTEKVNDTIGKLSGNGKLAEIADKYGLASELIPYNHESQTPTDDSWSNIQTKGEIVIGYTLFAPIAFKDANDKLIGFDIEFATAVFAELGIKPKFQEIAWEQKVTELNAKNIDVVWNGMSILDELKGQISISVPYMKNKQVAMIRKADVALYTKDLMTFKEAYVGVEKGSAGEKIFKNVIWPIIK